MNKIVTYTAIFLLLLGCNTKESEDVLVASVGEKELYISDVAAFIPNELPKEDSAVMAEDYIRNWVKKELVLKKAEENLAEKNKDVTKELEEYRQSLITYKYKKELVRQKMDTVVTEEQVQNYYNENHESFLLRNNIVKAIFMKIPNEFADPERLKMYCGDHSEESINELKDFCIRYAKVFDMFNDEWVNFDIVINNIPQNIDNQGRFLNRNNIIEETDSTYYYLACINDYRLVGQPAPIDHVSKNIKNVILNTRKIEFLKKTEEDIYQEGIRAKKFKIYDYQK